MQIASSITSVLLRLKYRISNLNPCFKCFGRIWQDAPRCLIFIIKKEEEKTNYKKIQNKTVITGQKIISYNDDTC